MDLLLDIDGTLWNTTGVIADAWRSGALALGVDGSVITADNLKKEFGKTMDVIFSDLYPDITDKELLRKIDAEFVKREEEALSALTEEDVQSILYPEVRSTIEELSKTHRLYIVSNCQAGYIEQFMEKSRTAEFITDHLCYGDTGNGKGDNIIALMDKNKVSPDNAFYIGDTKGDYEASSYAGIRMIHCSYGFGKADDAFEHINSFFDLLSLVDKLY
jgi:phosphoglycolate phosphatase